MASQTKENSPFEKLLQKYSKIPVKTDIYSLKAVKITLNDVLTECMSCLGFKTKFLYVDLQNFIGILSLILSGFTVYYSVYYKFQEVQKYIANCVFAYFFLSGISYILAYFYSKKLLFEDLEIKTEIKDRSSYIAVFHLKNKKVVKYYKEINDLFDERGILNHVQFFNDISKLDIKN